jgi:formate-dependent nitrite reductase cytochrome c552 subunit
MQYTKVGGHMNLVRDEETKAVINVNLNDYQKYIDQKTTKENEIQKIEFLGSEVANIKSDINEIKSLLHQIIKDYR